MHPDEPVPSDAPTQNEKFLSGRIAALERRAGDVVISQTEQQKETEIERRTQERLANLLDQLDSRLLTEAEATAMRQIILRDGRVQWLWSSARTMAIWIAAVFAGVTVGWEALRAAIKNLSQ